MRCASRRSGRKLWPSGTWSKLIQRGRKLYRERGDKEWPLTGCISFVVMQEQGLSEALTAGRHFEQAGFKALLA